MNAKILILSAMMLSAGSIISAQENSDSTELIETGVLYLDPLFEYPVAPEEITDFKEKCNWLADNFWNNLDVKVKTTVDQSKLNHAFHTYAMTVQYADKGKVTESVDRLMKTLQKNPMLLYQMTKAAEENIYGPRAEIWIDELYSRILRAALSNKKFPKTRRIRYEHQLRQLDATAVGGVPAEFDFERPNGDRARYFPMSTPTIIIFGDPECDSCRLGKLKMQSNVSFSKAVSDGRINVLFIIPDPDEGWQKRVSDFPKNWTVGGSDSVSDLYDLREIPEVYLIGSDGKIVNKHMGIMEAVTGALSLINK